VTAVSRIELRCDSCVAKTITDADPDDGDVTVPSKWSTLTILGGFGDALRIDKHLCPTCTERVVKASKTPGEP
jgi:hypothetical protein